MSRLYIRAALFVLALVTCRSAEAQTTALYFDSQPGDFIGQGVQQTWTTPALTFHVLSATPSTIWIRADDLASGGFTLWDLRFASPANGVLAPGTYESAVRYPFQSPAQPGLDIGGMGRGCNALAGRFVVYELVVNATGQVQQFAADFEQHCEDGVPALFGAIRFNAARPSLLPFDGAYPVYSIHVDSTPDGNVTSAGIDCGNGGADCDETYAAATTLTLTVTPAPGYTFLGWTGSCSNGLLATPMIINRRKACMPVFDATPGGGQVSPSRAANILFLDSQPGDFAGGGKRWVMSSPTTAFVAVHSSSPNVINLNLRIDDDFWNLSFASPRGTRLTPGTYDGAVGYPSESSLKPALSIGSCVGPLGRFIVYDIAVDASGQLQRFSADFEQHCGDAPGLFGAIRFNGDRDALIPFDGVYPVFSMHIDETPYGRVVGPGLNCGNGGTDCDETYATPTTITLTVTPSAGHPFLGWSGDCRGLLTVDSATGGISTSVTISRRKVCTPVFDTIPGFAPLVPVPPALLFLDSQPGDFIGGGQRRVMLPADAQFSLTGTTSHVTVSLTQVDGNSLFLLFSAPTGASLSPGAYEAATRDAFHSPLKPGLDIFGEGRGCNRVWGRFFVHEYVVDSAGQVQRFAADFEQHCEDGLPALLGAIRFNSTRDFMDPLLTLVPLYSLRVFASPNGSVQTNTITCQLRVDASSAPDCEQGATAGETVAITAVAAPGYAFVGWAGDCSGSAATVVSINHRKTCRALFDNVSGGLLPLPDLGASVFFDSQPGDYIGQGQRHIWIASDTLFRLGASTPRLLQFFVTTPDGDQWNLSFAVPAGDILHVGNFEGATRYPFQAASVPGMDISGHGRGCNQLTGRFRIHQIDYDSAGTLKAFAADFEQHCEGFMPPLYGAIRYNSDRASLTPFSSAGSAMRPPSDVNGDRQPDLIWRRLASGHNAVWLMNGINAGVTTLLTPGYAAQLPDLNWEIRAVADLNGDNQPDLIWQNKVNGYLAVWYCSGYTTIATTYIWGPWESDLNWKIVAAGDMDRDGLVDLLWRHRTSGAMRVWHMNGNAKWDSVPLLPVGDQMWEVAGLGDMNRDGWLDIIWRNYNDGSTAVWYMQDTRMINTAYMTPQSADINWRIVGVADMNGDNNPDLVWQHTPTGMLAVWFMRGIEMSTTSYLNPSIVADTNWRIVAVR